MSDVSGRWTVWTVRELYRLKSYVVGKWRSTATARLLLGCQPVSHPNSNPAHPLDASNPGGQFWTEQAGVGGLKSNSSDRCQPEVNGRGRILLLLKIESLAQNRGAVECETWFRAVPVDEVGYGTVISTLAAFGNEAIQDGGVRLFRIGKCQDPLGRSFLPTLF